MSTHNAQIIPDHGEDGPPELVALMAEFTDVTSVVKAAQRVRDAGFTRWDVHTPFPIHGIDKHMGFKPTILPWLVLGGGLAGLFGGLGLVWYTNAFDYQFLISGKPVFSLQANIPVIFETTVLASALTAVFGMLGLNKLPTLYNPLLRSERFRNVTRDRFYVVIEAEDPKFDEAGTAQMLSGLGATVVERVED